MLKKLSFVVVLITLIMLIGCHRVPDTFVKGQASGWKTIEFNDLCKGNYDVSWKKIIDTIAEKYDIEMIDKDNGYIRTGWMYGISGGRISSYRGRLTVKYPDMVSPDKVRIKTEAQWFGRRLWISGIDTIWEREVFNDLSGKIGRTVPEN